MNYPAYFKNSIGTFYKVESEKKHIAVKAHSYCNEMFVYTTVPFELTNEERITVEEWYEQLRKFHTNHMEFMQKELIERPAKLEFEIPTRKQVTGEPNISDKAEQTLINADL